MKGLTRADVAAVLRDYPSAAKAVDWTKPEVVAERARNAQERLSTRKGVITRT